MVRDPGWVKEKLDKARLQHVEPQKIVGRVEAETDPTQALWDASKALEGRAERRANRGSLYRYSAIASGVTAAGAIGLGIYAGSWWVGLGGGLAGLVGAIAAGGAAETAGTDSSAMKTESQTLRRLGYQARREARMENPGGAKLDSQVIQELADCGMQYFADANAKNPLDASAATKRLEAGQEFFIQEFGQIPVAVKTPEHLRFLDFMIGGGEPEGLSQPQMAQDIKKLCEAGQQPYIGWQPSGPLPVYRAALGEDIPNLTFGDIRDKVTAESIRAYGYFRYSLGHPSGRRGTGQVAEVPGAGRLHRQVEIPNNSTCVCPRIPRPRSR
ncbi:MAG: hypothetical protein HY319_00970 [Armatimonadetes bacterium]|nr:hypothetical protein [Armatimonadota bacterium]